MGEHAARGRSSVLAGSDPDEPPTTQAPQPEGLHTAREEGQDVIAPMARTMQYKSYNDTQN